MGVVVLTDPGTRYRQAVTDDTPDYALEGVRMEDAHRVAVHGGRTVVCVADGHGSSKVSEGEFVGGREYADAACHEAAHLALKGVRPAEIFERAQRALRAVRLPHTAWDGDALVHLHPPTRRRTSSACGTTLSLCVLTRRRAEFSFVGDSMGVLVRPDGTHVALGTPHTVASAPEVARMRAAGAELERRYFVSRVRGSTTRCAVSRSLGHFGNTAILQAPDTVRVALGEGDRVVIASDGLWDAVGRAEAAGVVRASTSDRDACESLLQIARSAAGPRDNVTVAVASPARRGGCSVM